MKQYLNIMKKINSKQKGARGERLFRDLLKFYGYEARRGKQYSGNEEAPDVVHNVPNTHFEVKFVEKLNIRQAMEQAKNDCGNKIPVVAHKTKNGEWLVTLQAQNYLMLRCFEGD